MKLKNKLIIIILCLLFCGCATEYIAHVDNNLWRGSRQSDLSKLDQFTKIIDLEEENQFVEAERQYAGNRFKHIPLSETKAPTKEQLLSILKEIIETDGPVFVHCRRGKDRTGYAIMTYRILINKWEIDRAYAEALSYGHSAWVYKNWKSVLQELQTP